MNFPKNTSEMPDRIWETYCCLVWCNNSLNAEEFSIRHLALHHTADLLHRAQFVINKLLEDSGRLDEYINWEKRKEINDARLQY